MYDNSNRPKILLPIRLHHRQVVALIELLKDTDELNELESSCLITLEKIREHQERKFAQNGPTPSRQRRYDSNENTYQNTDPA